MCCVNHKCSELTLCYLCTKARVQARVKRYTSTSIYAHITHTFPPLCPKESRLEDPCRTQTFAVNQPSNGIYSCTPRLITLFEKSVNNTTLTFNPIFPAPAYILY